MTTEKETAAKPLDFIRQIIAEDLASGKHQAIVTRFPPEPNGFLHIGHAKSICLNFGVAEEHNAVCHLRFDDTNPDKESIDYVEAIQRDVRWLGFDWGEHLYYASDYFDQLYEFAVQLIRRGKAYVCHLSGEEMRAYRGTLTEPGRESPYRNRTVEENLELIERMRSGVMAEGECVLRAKIDMASPNIVLRDPVLYRILKSKHHRTGDRWCIYPMYDFTHCLSDMLE
ncbi:MAG: glutamine--tRNA ligase, partial [Desulfobulbus sp.]|nr:glutamine--tRNA ligase [Desulfobulbus sp.]